MAVRYALAYPNRYAVGMANLGVQTLWRLLSEAPGGACERFFADRPQSLESGRRLDAVDVVAFSVSFEGDYPALVSMLADAGIPPRAADRRDGHPLVLVGGIAPSLNPEPLAPVADAIFVGEAEGRLDALHGFFTRQGLRPRTEALDRLAGEPLPGLYVPSRHPPRAQVAFQRAPEGFAPARSYGVTPDDAFGGAYLLEISRGCPHGCRYCAAGYATRPFRCHPAETLLPYLRRGVEAVGRVGLVGAAVSDHPEFPALARWIVAAGGTFAVSSFRAENLDEEMVGLLKQGGLRTLTVALESGGAGLRARIGKDLGEEDILRAAALARGKLPGGLRIYAMIGLPGETDADVEALADIASRAKGALGRANVTLSVSPFVPKPHTPFQWEAMADEATLDGRLRLLSRLTARTPGLKLLSDSPKWARVQGLFARGGREAGEWLLEQRGGEAWSRILKRPEARALLDAPRPTGEALPWDFLAGMPSRAHLLAEREAALGGLPPGRCPSASCRSCALCGRASAEPAP